MMRSQLLAQWFGMTSQKVLLLLVAIVALIVLAVAASGPLAGAQATAASAATQGHSLLATLREAAQLGL